MPHCNSLLFIYPTLTSAVESVITTYLRRNHYLRRPSTTRNGALRTPEERLPSEGPKEAFGRMIFQKKSSLGDRTKHGKTTLAGARGGAGPCDAPCISWRVLDSAFIQARVRLSCSDCLIYTGRHTFRRHASPPRASAADL